MTRATSKNKNGQQTAESRVGSKVFGIGFGRTGTKSLNEALCILGIPSIHYPTDRQTYHELNNGIFELTLFEQYQAVTDITLLPYFPQFDATFPGSRFILTVRDKEDWLDCYAKSFEEVEEQSLLKKYKRLMRRRLVSLGGVPRCLFNLRFYRDLLDLPHRAHRIESQRVAIYGTTQRNNRDHLGYLFDRHHEHVEHYFRDRADDLLVMNIFDGDGWDVLCPFLGKPIPDVPFPWKKSKKD